MAIFDLEQIAHDTVGGHGHYEVSSGGLEVFRVFIAIGGSEILEHSDVGLAAELVAGFCVWHAFDYAALKVKFNCF